MNWEQFVNRLQASSAGMSLSLNFILILLIIKKSPEQLGSYRYLMVYIALFEIFYSVVDVVISPIIFSYGSMYFVIVITKDSIFSRRVLLMLDSVWCGCFGTFMALFCIQFIYRYLVVVGSDTIKSFNDYRMMFWTMIPILVGTVWGTMSFFLAGPRPQLDAILQNLLLTKTDLVFKDITYLGPQCFYENSNGEMAINSDSIIALSFMLFIMTSSLLCITFFAIKTFLKIRNTLNNSTMTSNKYNRLQWQTFYALVTQTLIPVILMHFPCILIMSAAMLEVDLGHTSGIVSVTFALFPALDPLPVMLIIKNYRGTLWNVMSSSVNIFVRKHARTK